MRNFKLFFGIIAMTVLMVGVWSCSKDSKHEKVTNNVAVEVRTQGKSCLELDPPPITGSCSDGVYTNVISVPQYPGCLFYIKTKYILCTAFGPQIFFIGDYEIYDYVCPQFTIDALTANSTWWANFNIQVWQEVTNGLLNNLVSSTNSSTNFTYVTASCNKICFVESKVGESGRTAILPVRQACTDDCCKVERRYSRNLSNGWDLNYLNYTSLGGNCVNDNLPCPPKTVSSLPCMDGCQALLDF